MPQGSKFNTFIKSHLDSLLAAIVGFCLVQVYTAYSGIGISPDSIMYMSTARSLNALQGFNFWGHQPIVLFPVFFPTFLAIVQFITHTDPLILGPVLDGCLFGLLIFLTGLTIERYTCPSKIYKWLVLIALALSPGLLEIYTMLWSETLFMVWVLVFILAYHNYVQKRSIQSLLIVVLVTALACITRYVAFTLVCTGGMLLLFDQALSVKKKIGHILLFGFGSITLLATNLIRNALVSNTSTGTRYKSLTSLGENMHYCGTVLCDWLTLGQRQYNLATTLTGVIVLTFVAVFLYHAFVKKSKYNTYENITIAFFVVYALFMLIWASISRFERINNRLLSPLFIPLILGGSYWIPDVVKLVRGRFKIPAITLSIAIGLLFIYGEVKNDLQRYDDENDYGIPGYTDDSWNKSALISFMKANPGLFKPGYPVYNNAVEAFYFFTLKPSEYIPKKADGLKLNKLYSQKHFYVVSFDLLPDTALTSIASINQHKPLKTLFHNADGGIYEYNGDGK